MGFSHTSPMATQVLQHKCDQWASADAGIVRQDSPRASRPQAILKLRPPSSLGSELYLDASAKSSNLERTLVYIAGSQAKLGV